MIRKRKLKKVVWYENVNKSSLKNEGENERNAVVFSKKL